MAYTKMITSIYLYLSLGGLWIIFKFCLISFSIFMRRQYWVLIQFSVKEGRTYERTKDSDFFSQGQAWGVGQCSQAPCNSDGLGRAVTECFWKALTRVKGRSEAWLSAEANSPGKLEVKTQRVMFICSLSTFLTASSYNSPYPSVAKKDKESQPFCSSNMPASFSPQGLVPVLLPCQPCYPLSTSHYLSH